MVFKVRISVHAYNNTLSLLSYVYGYKPSIFFFDKEPSILYQEKNHQFNNLTIILSSI